MHKKKVEYLVHFILYVKLNLKDILLKELCMKINGFRAREDFMWKMLILRDFTIYLGWKTSSDAQKSFRCVNFIIYNGFRLSLCVGLHRN